MGRVAQGFAHGREGDVLEEIEALTARIEGLLVDLRRDDEEAT